MKLVENLTKLSDQTKKLTRNTEWGILASKLLLCASDNKFDESKATCLIEKLNEIFEKKKLEKIDPKAIKEELWDLKNHLKVKIP